VKYFYLVEKQKAVISQARLQGKNRQQLKLKIIVKKKAKEKKRKF